MLYDPLNSLPKELEDRFVEDQIRLLCEPHPPRLDRAWLRRQGWLKCETELTERCDGCTSFYDCL